MSRRATMRPARPVTLAVAIESYPDFDPSDYARRPTTGWTASALWSAAWSYAYTHADGYRAVALVAFRTYARAHARDALRQDVHARLGGVDYSAGPWMAE